MESRDQDGFAEHVTVHGVDDSGARGGGFLRRALRNLELRVERVQLERVVMIWTGRRAGTHVGVRSQAHLTAAVGQLALRETFGESSRRAGNVPDQPVRDVHLRSLREHRLGKGSKMDITHWLIW